MPVYNPGNFCLNIPALIFSMRSIYSTTLPLTVVQRAFRYTTFRPTLPLRYSCSPYDSVVKVLTSHLSICLQFYYSLDFFSSSLLNRSVLYAEHHQSPHERSFFVCLSSTWPLYSIIFTGLPLFVPTIFYFYFCSLNYKDCTVLPMRVAYVVFLAYFLPLLPFPRGTECGPRPIQTSSMISIVLPTLSLFQQHMVQPSCLLTP